MNLIIPMAGRGSRIRPHSLTVPKPLLPVAGKPIVQRLAEDIIGSMDAKIEHIGFVTGDFGREAEDRLLEVAAALGAEGHIFHQDQPLGTAHAIYCAETLLDEKVVVAFADTLFRADFKIDTEKDGIIWVQKVEDPSAFGVVKIDDRGIISELVEKPRTPVSDLAIIGIYYFKNGALLHEQIRHIIDNDIRVKGEYQLTTCLENMKNLGQEFHVAEVDEWLDCGNKEHFVYTNQRVLEFLLEKGEELVSPSAVLENAIVIPPSFIAGGAEISHAVIGPHVSVGSGTVIRNSVIRNSVIRDDSHIENKIIENAMIGTHVTLKDRAGDLSLGDYTSIVE